MRGANIAASSYSTSYYINPPQGAGSMRQMRPQRALGYSDQDGKAEAGEDQSATDATPIVVPKDHKKNM